jgi:hypothetical protein
MSTRNAARSARSGRRQVTFPELQTTKNPMLSHEVFCLFDVWPLMAGVLRAVTPNPPAFSRLNNQR